VIRERSNHFEERALFGGIYLCCISTEHRDSNSCQRIFLFINHNAHVPPFLFNSLEAVYENWSIVAKTYSITEII
jgi:hypothetical protein